MKPISSFSCLIIIDMINGFVKEGPLADPAIRLIIEPIEQIIKDFKQKDYPIIALCDAHDLDCGEFDVFLPHCIKGDQESELIDEFKPYSSSMVVCEKNSVNGFLSPAFKEWFDDQPFYTNYVVVGCVTDICVLNFASTLQAYLHQHNVDSHVIVSKDTSETYHTDNHPRESFNHMAYTLMAQLGVQVNDYVTFDNL